MMDPMELEREMEMDMEDVPMLRMMIEETGRLSLLRLQMTLIFSNSMIQLPNIE